MKSGRTQISSFIIGIAMVLFLLIASAVLIFTNRYAEHLTQTKRHIFAVLFLIYAVFRIYRLLHQYRKISEES